jgi:hypothetical protein
MGYRLFSLINRFAKRNDEIYLIIYQPVFLSAALFDVFSSLQAHSDALLARYVSVQARYGSLQTRWFIVSARELTSQSATKKITRRDLNAATRLLTLQSRYGV